MEFKQVYKQINALTDDQIQQARMMYTTTKCSYKQLAKEFCVTVGQIKKALKGVTKWQLPVLQRFDEKWTKNENGCHIWNACKDQDDYGMFRLKNKIIRAHIVSYLLNKGEVPKGLKVRHTCDEPSCVNPDHLILGTVIQNNQDKIERFREPWQYPAIDYLEMRFLIEIGVLEEAIINRFGIKKATLKRRLKDMAKTANDPTQDKVFHYRDRAIHEVREKDESNSPIEIIIDRVIE